MNTSSNILTTKSIGVNNVSAIADLECSSHNNIIFDTPNLLIRDLRIDKHIKNLIFSESNIDLPTVYRVDRHAAPDQINVTSAGESVLTGVDTLEVSSLNSFVNDNGTQQEHYVNLTVSDSNVLRINSSNIFVEDQLFYNYIYDLVNEAIIIDSDTGGAVYDNSTQDIVNDQNQTERFNATNMGEYITNTIYTDNITTHNIFVNSSEDLITEPSLHFKSRSAVNLNALNVQINEFDLDTFIKQTLNEIGLINVNITPRSGLSISYTYNDVEWFLNTVYGDRFTYDITFRIYDHGEALENLNDPTYVRDVVINSNINQGIYPNTSSTGLSYPNVFDENLIAGASYDIYASVRNQLTNTTVPNILVAENVFTIPPLEIISINVLDETKVQIIYKQHQIQIDDFTPVVSFALSVVKDSDVVPALDDENAFVNPPSPHNFPTQDLDQNFSTAEQSYIYRVVDFTNRSLYDSTYMVDGIDNFFHITNNLGMVSTFTLLWTTWQNFFTPPSPPTNLNILYSPTNTYTFSWTPPSNTGNAVNMYYKIYFNGVLYENNDNIFGTTTTSIIASPITSGNWAVVAYNVYGDETASAAFVVTTPILNIQNITGIGGKRFQIQYQANQFNRKYDLTANQFQSKSNLNSTTGTMQTSATLEPGTYIFTVNLVDDLNKTASDDDTLIILTPEVLINPALTYVSGSVRQFYVDITTSNINGGGFSVKPGTNPSLSDAVFNNLNSNRLFFTFNDRINEGAKSCNVTIIDNWGYDDNDSRNDLILVINDFVDVTTVISQQQGNRTFTYATNGLTNYVWYRDGAQIGTGTSPSFTVDNVAGSYYAIATQSNNQGFTRELAESNRITVTLPSISQGSFDITAQPSTYTYEFTYNGVTYSFPSLPPNSSISLAPSNIFTSGGLYQLRVFITDEHGFSANLIVGSFNVVLPNAPRVGFGTITQYSIQVTWGSLGGDGTPSEAVNTIRLYYHTSSNVSSSAFTAFIDITPNSNHVFESLTIDTVYYFRIIKTYDNYGTINSPVISQATQGFVQPTAPSGLSSSTTNTTSITMTWSSLGDNGSPSATPVFIRLYYSTSSFTKTNPPGTHVALTESDTNTVISGLNPGITYYFMIIKQYDQHNYGTVASAIVNASTTADPPQLTNNVISEVSNKDFVISWEVANAGTPPFTDYNITFVPSVTSLSQTYAGYPATTIKYTVSSFPYYFLATDTNVQVNVSTTGSSTNATFNNTFNITDFITNPEPVRSRFIFFTSSTKTIKATWTAPFKLGIKDGTQGDTNQETVNGVEITIHDIRYISELYLVDFDNTEVLLDSKVSTELQHEFQIGDTHGRFFFKIYSDNRVFRSLVARTPNYDRFNNTIKYYGFGVNSSGQTGVYPLFHDLNSDNFRNGVGASRLPFNWDDHNLNSFPLYQQKVMVNMTNGWGTSFFHDNGRLYASGRNKFRQIGVGSTQDKVSIAKPVLGLDGKTVLHACGGFEFSMILTDDGKLFSIGKNDKGQCGTGNTNNITSLHHVASDVTFMVTGYDHTIIQKTDGSLWGTGDNSFGQLGISTAGNTVTTFTQIDSIPAGVTVVKFMCGRYTTFIKNDSSPPVFYSCGKNVDGELAQGTSDSNPHNTFAPANAINGLSGIVDVYPTKSGLYIRTNSQLLQIGRFTVHGIFADRFKARRDLTPQVIPFGGALQDVHVFNLSNDLVFVTNGRIRKGASEYPIINAAGNYEFISPNHPDARYDHRELTPGFTIPSNETLINLSGSDDFKLVVTRIT